MDAIFAPGSIAVFGASETPGGVGQKLMKNLASFRGVLYPINPKRQSVFGIGAFPTITAIGKEVDMAVIATPARSVPALVRECSEAGVKGAIIISAGFKECGAEGAELERQIAMNRGRMRIIGPNCLGVQVPHNGLNATFAKSMATDGKVAFLSQSGALYSSILDWSTREQVGFSAFVSTGSMVDVQWGDLIYYLGDDFRTRSILIYMESIGDARSFLSAAREVALSKPIIILKVGRTTGAAQAVVSHTGSLAGSDEALEAAFSRAGVLRVDTIEELFGLAGVLANQPRPSGPRLAIVTNGGGPGALAVDALLSAGGELAQLSETTFAALNAFLPPFWSRNNPVDLLSDADAGRFAQAIQVVADDPLNNGVLVILTPQAMTQAVETAARLRQLPKLDKKPILACWMGGSEVEGGERILREAGIPTFPYPDAAAQAFCALSRYSRNLDAFYETPALRVSSTNTASAERARSSIAATYAAGRVLMTGVESKELLDAYEIPTVPTRVASTEDEAVRLAAAFAGPVVLKIFSLTITHKSDVGGVKLDLRDSEAVRQAYRAIEQSVREKFGPEAFLGVTVQPMVRFDGYEIILGSATDPQLGPVMIFGSGGQLVEVMKDRALGLPPLNLTLARRLIEQCRIFQALKGVRGREPVKLDQLETLLIRFSRLVAEQRRIKEIDINPLLVSPKQFAAVDARVVLHNPALADEELPKLAIRPYPTEYIFPAMLKDGTAVTLRPICPEDEPLVADFHKTLSEETVHYRYFGLIKLEQRIAHSRLTRICFNDYDCEIALVVERKLAGAGERQILGIGRLIRSRGIDEAEFAIVISDPWQGKGLGTELLYRLLDIGRQEKMGRIVAFILPDNVGMRRVCTKLGFSVRYDANAEAYRAEISLVER
jgi:acetyltransferase